jgi:hypothetical protein
MRSCVVAHEWGCALGGTQGVPASSGGMCQRQGHADVTRFRATRYSGATIKPGYFRSPIVHAENHYV